MEFTFSVNEIFKEPIVEINQNLIPPGFSGDRRALWDTVTKVSEVVNAMGEASAAAQGLTKPVTTAERLRNTDKQKIFLLIDQQANSGRGAVTGMLKTGQKGLYVFDKEGNHYQVSPPCVLDFYVHESRQRNGFGKRLFEHMLEKEQVQPIEMALDRPSDKFLNFLNKYYALNQPIKQMNNYVVFDGFFPQRGDANNAVDAEKVSTPLKKNTANGLQAAPSPYGRYGAPRPPCSMGQIIHNQSSTINRGHPAGVQSVPATNYQHFQSPMQNPSGSQSTPNMHYNHPMQNQNMITASTNYGYGMQGVTNPSVTAANVQPGNQYVNSPQSMNALYQGHNFANQQMQYPSQYHANQQQTNFQNQNYNQQQNQQAAYLMQNHPAGENPVNQLQMTKQQIAVNQHQQNRQPMQHTYNQAKGETQMDDSPAVANQQSAAFYGHSQPRVENMGNQYPHMTNPQTAASNYQFVNNSSQMQQLLSQNAENIPSHMNNQQQIYNAQPAQRYQSNAPNITQNKDVGYVTTTAGDESNSRHLNTNQPLHSVDNFKNVSQADQMPQFRNFQNQAMPNVVPANLPNPNVHHSTTNVMANAPNMPPQPATTYSVPNTQLNAGQAAHMEQGHWSQPNMTHSLPNMPAPTGVNMAQSLPTAPMHHMPYPVGQNVSNYGVHPSQPNLGLHQLPMQSTPNMNINALNTTPATPPQIYQSYSEMNQQPNQMTMQQSLPNVKAEEHVFPDQSQQYYNPAVTQSQAVVNPTQTVQHNQPLVNPSLVQNNPFQTTYQPGNPRQPHTISVNPASMHIPTNVQQMQHVPQSPEQVMNKPSEMINQNQYENVGQAGDFATPQMQTMSRSDFNQREIPLPNQTKSVTHMQNNEQPQEDDDTLKYGYPPQISNDQKPSEEKSTPKLERPRSLSLQQSEEQSEEKNIEGEIKLELVEEIIQDVKTDVENIKLDDSVEEKIGDTIEDLSKSEADVMNSEKKTPSHLTEKGYFDLKFYHNKLW